MTFINRLKHGVDLTKFKTDQMLRINRVQSEIDELNQRIAALQRQLATFAYDLHQRGALVHRELEDLCLVVDELNRSITERENAIAAIRSEQAPEYVEPLPVVNGVLCLACGFDMPAFADFCPNCGQRSARPNSIPAEPISRNFEEKIS